MVAAVVVGAALSAIGNPVQAAANDKALTDINRYCATCWRNARLPQDSWSDCTQEVFLRLLRRVAPSDWNRVLLAEGDERREFLRAIDAVKKRVQRSRKFLPMACDLADSSSDPDVEIRDDREQWNKAAEELLTPRQQEILRMTVAGWSVQDIADELDMTAARVSDEKYKAIRKLRSHLESRDESA
jgi:RNA polymerase sigma factor (sigma-70 family)